MSSTRSRLHGKLPSVSCCAKLKPPTVMQTAATSVYLEICASALLSWTGYSDVPPEPECSGVKAQAYSDYIAMTIQGDTNPVGANDKNSDAVMLSLSTETNAVSSAASA